MARAACILALLAACVEQPTGEPPGEPATTTPAERSPDYRNPGMTTAGAEGIALVARDPASGDLGAIAATRSPACGAWVVEARAGAGAAVALGQVGGGWRDALFGRLGAGGSADLAVRGFVETAVDRARRRPLIAVDARGGHATHTGIATATAAAGVEGFAVLVSGLADFAEADLDAVRAHWRAGAELPLAERLVATLAHACGEAADLGGDRALRSAALLVVRPDAGPFGRSDRLVDVRVDWHLDPVTELDRALEIQLRAYVGPRLAAMQRRLDRDSPIYALNAAWLERIRTRMLTGDER